MIEIKVMPVLFNLLVHHEVLKGFQSITCIRYIIAHAGHTQPVPLQVPSDNETSSATAA